MLRQVARVAASSGGGEGALCALYRAFSRILARNSASGQRGEMRFTKSICDIFAFESALKVCCLWPAAAALEDERLRLDHHLGLSRGPASGQRRTCCCSPAGRRKSGAARDNSARDPASLGPARLNFGRRVRGRRAQERHPRGVGALLRAVGRRQKCAVGTSDRNKPAAH